jgi:hypothetical protein
MNVSNVYHFKGGLVCLGGVKVSAGAGGLGQDRPRGQVAWVGRRLGEASQGASTGARGRLSPALLAR